MILQLEIILDYPSEGNDTNRVLKWDSWNKESRGGGAKCNITKITFWTLKCHPFVPLFLYLRLNCHLSLFFLLSENSVCVCVLIWLLHDFPSELAFRSYCAILWFYFLFNYPTCSWNFLKFIGLNLSFILKIDHLYFNKKLILAFSK